MYEAQFDEQKAHQRSGADTGWGSGSAERAAPRDESPAVGQFDLYTIRPVQRNPIRDGFELVVSTIPRLNHTRATTAGLDDAVMFGECDIRQDEQRIAR